MRSEAPGQGLQTADREFGLQSTRVVGIRPELVADAEWCHAEDLLIVANGGEVPG